MAWNSDSDSFRDTLIKTIALKHGVAVGRDDPILILLTVNEELMRANEAATQELLGRQREHLEAISKRWADDSTARAERFLNIALAETHKAMEQTMASGATVAANALQHELSLALDQVRNQKNRAWLMAALNIASSIITLAAALVVVWRGF